MLNHTWIVGVLTFQLVFGPHQALSTKAIHTVETEAFYTRYLTGHDRILYAQAKGGRLYAIDITNKRVKWQFHMPQAIVVSAPAFANRLLFVAVPFENEESRLIAIDQEHGTVRWQSSFSSLGGTPTPVVCGDSVLITDFKTGVAAGFDSQDGNRRWDSTKLAYHFFHSPAVKGKLAYYVVRPTGLASSSGGIAVVDCSNGTLAQFLDVEGIGVSRNPIEFVSDRLFLSRNLPHSIGSVIGLHDPAGRKVWETRLENTVNPHVELVNDMLVVGNGDLWGLNLESGRIVFHDQLKSGPGSFAVAGKTVVYQVGERMLIAKELGSGATKWKRTLREPLLSNLANCNSHVCAKTMQNQVSAFDPHTGRTVFSVQLTSESKAKPAPARSSKQRF